MKKLIESTKRLQGDIDRCISRLVNARQYHDKIDEAGAVLDMERLLVSSAQQLQCCIDKLEECGSVVEWQTDEPKENGLYLVTTYYGKVKVDEFCYYSASGKEYGTFIKYADPVAWCKLSDIKPYKEKEE